MKKLCLAVLLLASATITAPAIEFGALVERVVDDNVLRGKIDALLVKKRAGAELEKGPRNAVLSGFLEKELIRLRAEVQPPAKTRDPAALDRLFVDMLQEVNGSDLESTVPV